MLTLPSLPYTYDALEPHFDKETMEIHHTKHHQAYIDKANAALKGTDWEEEPVESILADLASLPKGIQMAVRNNAGGHANHSFFWELLSVDSDTQSAPTLMAQIEKDLGGFTKAKEDFGNAATTRFGSGWAWIVWDGKKLKVTSSANQDSPLSDGETPIIGLDVWEHAYYLHYQNRRPDYVGAFWNVLNWEKAEEHFTKAQ